MAPRIKHDGNGIQKTRLGTIRTKPRKKNGKRANYMFFAKKAST